MRMKFKLNLVNEYFLCHSDSPRLSPRTVPTTTTKSRPTMPRERESETGTPKHDIVVVTEGNVPEKDPDPELTKLNTIPVFYPIMRGSLNIPTSSRDLDLLDKMNHEQLLYLCVRYQEHLKQLAESVTFDQNALCVRIKEVNIYPVCNQFLDHKNLNSFKEIINNMKRFSGI